MSCKRCREKAAPRPCVECVTEHIRRAQTAARDAGSLRDRFRACWHLAQAAAMTSDSRLRQNLVSARIAWQRNGIRPDWEGLVDAAASYKEQNPWT